MSRASILWPEVLVHVRSEALLGDVSLEGGCFRGRFGKRSLIQIGNILAICFGKIAETAGYLRSVDHPERH